MQVVSSQWQNLFSWKKNNKTKQNKKNNNKKQKQQQQQQQQKIINLASAEFSQRMIKCQRGDNLRNVNAYFL